MRNLTHGGDARARPGRSSLGRAVTRATARLVEHRPTYGAAAIVVIPRVVRRVVILITVGDAEVAAAVPQPDSTYPGACRAAREPRPDWGDGPLPHSGRAGLEWRFVAGQGLRRTRSYRTI